MNAVIFDNVRVLRRMWGLCVGHQDPEHDQVVWQAHSSEQGELLFVGSGNIIRGCCRTPMIIDQEITQEFSWFAVFSDWNLNSRSF